jgi:hypothetical protein
MSKLVEFTYWDKLTEIEISVEIELFQPAAAAGVTDTGLSALRVKSEGETTAIVPGFSFWSKSDEEKVQVVAIANTELEYAHWLVVFSPDNKPMAIRTLPVREFWMSFDKNDSSRAMDYPVRRIEMLAAEQAHVEAIQGGPYFNWSVSGVGFGQLSMYVNNEGGYTIQNEGLGKNLIKSIFCALVDGATLEH